MKRCFLAATCLLFFNAGCAWHEAWLADRSLDAADIFTFSYGLGAGGKARAGVFHAGLAMIGDRGGLRGGEFTPLYRPKEGSLGVPGEGEAEFTLISIERFESGGESRWGDERLKHYIAYGAAGVSLAGPTMGRGFPLSYYTQIEVSGGLGGTLRLGANPGEALDFVLSFAGIDLFGDDLGGRARRIYRRRGPAGVATDVEREGFLWRGLRFMPGMTVAQVEAEIARGIQRGVLPLEPVQDRSGDYWIIQLSSSASSEDNLLLLFFYHGLVRSLFVQPKTHATADSRTERWREQP